MSDDIYYEECSRCGCEFEEDRIMWGDDGSLLCPECWEKDWDRKNMPET